MNESFKLEGNKENRMPAIFSAVKNLSDSGLTLKDAAEAWENAPVVDIANLLENKDVKGCMLEGYDVCLMII